MLELVVAELLAELELFDDELVVDEFDDELVDDELDEPEVSSLALLSSFLPN